MKWASAAASAAGAAATTAANDFAHTSHAYQSSGSTSLTVVTNYMDLALISRFSD